MSQMSNTNENTCSLFSWSITGKRGRKPTATTSSYSSSISSAEEEETAHFLLMLSSTSSTITNRVENHHLHEYRCESCGKSFSSYQALGGHRAGHFKNAKTAHHIDNQVNNKRSVGGGEKTEEGFDQAGGEVLLMKKNQKMHQCPICKMGFSSGQALGGHKRSHWERKTNGINDNIVAAEEESRNEKMKKKKSRLISSLCLNLNLPPPLSDKEEEAAAAAAAEVSSAPPAAAAASLLMATSYCYC